MRRMTCHARRGAAMLMVLIATATGVTLTVGWLAAQDNSVLMAANATNAATSRATAQCGLELAVALLESEAPWQTAHDDGWILQNHPIGNGTLDVRLIDALTGLPPNAATTSVRIEAIGSTDSMVQHATVMATVHQFNSDSPGDLSGYAIFARNGLRISGPSRIRSLDGGQRILGVHGSLDVSGRAARDLRSGDLSLHLPSNRFHGVPDSASLAALPLLLGSIGTDALDLPVSPAFEESGRPQHMTLPARSHQTVLDSIVLADDLHLRQNATLIIEQDCEIHVLGNLELDHGAAIEIAEGVECTIVVSGDVALDNAVIGAPQDRSPRFGSWNPSNITRTDTTRIRVTTPRDCEQSDWSIRRGSLIQGVIEAPSAEIQLERSTVSGRIVGDSVHLRQNARLYFDHSSSSGVGLASLTHVTDHLDLMDLRDDGLDPNARAEMIARLSDLLGREAATSITSPIDGWWIHRPIPVNATMTRMGGDVKNWEIAVMDSDDLGGRP